MKGKDGEIGCLQIIPKYHPNIDPTDFEASVRYFINEYKAGRDWQWTGCSCSRSASLTIKNFPIKNASEYVPNANMVTGKAVILKYGKTYHIASYTVTPEGLQLRKEGNFVPCKLADRLLGWKELNKHIVGFYVPEKR